MTIKEGRENLQANPPISRGANIPVILLADDEPVVVKCVRYVLEQANYAVLVATTAEQALQRMQTSERIDLLITDVWLPDKSGLTLAAEFTKSRPHTPTLIMSGMPVNRSTGGAGALLKPFTPDELRMQVQTALLAHAVRQNEPMAPGECESGTNPEGLVNG
jgi:DNA-binding response OmpR family regulator